MLAVLTVLLVKNGVAKNQCAIFPDLHLITSLDTDIQIFEKAVLDIEAPDLDLKYLLNAPILFAFFPLV